MSMCLMVFISTTTIEEIMRLWSLLSTTASKETKAMMEFEESKRKLHFTLERINAEIPFAFHYVTSDFCPSSSFSTVDLQLAVHNNGLGQYALNFNTLFKVDVEPQHAEALKFIHRSRSHPWPPFHPDPNFKQSEKSIMLSICSEILLPLCREVILEKTYQADLSKWPMITGLECSDIGMGSKDTWHGTPDVRVRGGTEVVCRKEAGDSFVVDDVESDDESVTSDGMTTTIEGKIVYSDANLPQLVSTNVISSFTEKSLHPKKPALVPTILIDGKLFRVSLYDSEKDVLLISEKKLLTTKGGLSQSAMALLWVVLNHR